MLKKLPPSRLSLLLIPAVLSLFWPVLLDPTLILFPTFSQFSDTMVIHWPKARLMADSWQAGHGLPYWTPLILSGMPLAANQLAMLFYPPAWLFLILPIEPVFNLLFIFHLLLGGYGVYFLLREVFYLSPIAALFGGLTFALNGKWLAHAAGGHVSMVGAIGWLPWIALGMHFLLGRRNVSDPTQPGKQQRSGGAEERKRWLLCYGVGIALALQITTHTLPVIYSVYLITAMVAWHFIAIEPLWRGGWRLARSLSLPLLAIPVVAGLLGIVQLWPLLELAQFSNRSLSLEQAALYATTPLQLVVGLLLPTAQAGHELIIYLGLVPLLLALLGISRLNRWSWFYGGVLIFSILFALGPSTPLHALFYQFAPGFRWVRTPARMFFVGALAVAILVGFGVERLRHKRWSPADQRWLMRLTVGLGGLAAMVGLGLIVGFGQWSRAPIALAFIIPAGLILILLRVKRLLTLPMVLTLLGLLLYLDLASFGGSMMHFVPRSEALAPGAAAAEYLAQQPGPFRVYSPSYSLPMQTAAAFDLQLADGVEPVHLAVYDQFMAQAGGYQDASFSVTIPNFGSGPLDSALSDIKPDLRLLGLLNVEYLASAFPMAWPGLALEQEIDGTFIYKNGQVLPRAWIARQAVPIEDDWLAQLKTLPLAEVVAVETGPFLTGSDPTVQPIPPEPATITHYTPDRIEIKVATLDEPGGWLVISELWYPGWQATVNGTPRPVEKVNGLLRGLYLDPEGPYRITLTYQPRSLVWGGWISGVTAMVILSSGVWLTIGSKRYPQMRQGSS